MQSINTSTVAGHIDRRAFRSDIQGLRAIAVCSVVLFHAFGSGLPGGFVGVDIFFVISGYLISGVIFGRLQKGDFSIADFYRRRVRRIFPALYFMLVVVAVAGLFCMAPHDFNEFSQTVISTIFFYSNREFIYLGGYFAGASDLKPLLHTWSLAVEEQFYLFYPPILLVLWRMRRGWIGPALCAAALFSLAYSCWETVRHPAEAYFMAPVRFHELLIGAICAYWSIGTTWSRRTGSAVTAIGLACMAGAIAFFDSSAPFPGFLALLPCVGAALVIAGGEGGTTFFDKVSSSAIISYLGEISFSLYLWHWPVLALQRQLLMGPRTVPEAVGALAVAAVLAAFSLRFIERPLLHASLRRPLLKTAVIVMAAGSLVAGCAVRADGIPQRFSASARQFFAGASDINPRREACHSGSTPIPYERNCVWGDAKPVVAVWGDSHGAELSVALGQLTKPLGRGVMEITASACPPSQTYVPPEQSYCRRHNQDSLKRLSDDSRITQVILVANYIDYRGPGLDSIVQGVFESALALGKAGKRVVLVLPIPVFEFDPPARLGIASQYGQSAQDVGGPVESYVAAATDIRHALLDFSHVHGLETIDPAAVLCDRVICHAYRADVGTLYFNSNHLSVAGAGVVAQKLGQEIVAGR